MFWLGDENEFWCEKARQPFRVNLHGSKSVISFSDSSVHIVAEFPHCSVKTEVLFTNSPLHSICSQLFAFPPLLWNEVQGRLRLIFEAECINMYFKWFLGSDHSHTQRRKSLSLSLLRLNCEICVCYLSFSQLDVPSFLLKNINILHLYSFHRENKHLFIRNVEFIVSWLLDKTL